MFIDIKQLTTISPEEDNNNNFSFKEKDKGGLTR